MKNPLQTEQKTYSLHQLDEIADWLLTKSAGKRVWTLSGDLGAGKTTLCTALAAKMKVQDQISSPTFALAQQYRLPNNSHIHHLDLYRIKDIDEALAMGIEEYLYSGEYCWIEWPDVIEPLLPEDTFHIRLEMAKEGRRKIVILP